MEKNAPIYLNRNGLSRSKLWFRIAKLTAVDVLHLNRLVCMLCNSYHGRESSHSGLIKKVCKDLSEYERLRLKY